jgi:predicted ATPase
MIEYIELKNFKSIKEKRFNLKKLNILLGLNGQGKSSFIQSLLLLRQSDEKLNKGILTLNSDLIKIGNSKDALYQYAKGKLEIALKLSDKEEERMAFDYTADSDIFTMSSSKPNDTKDLLKDRQDEGLFNYGFQYLNADRVEPKTLHQRSYSNAFFYRNLGVKGEYTVDFLEVNASEPVSFQNCLHPNTNIIRTHTGEKRKDNRLINQVNLWLSEISPEVAVKTEYVTSDHVKLEFEFAQPTFGTTMPFKPENVGFGISYALHVVTALLAARSGSLVIIENPESHIHPRGQAELGKLITLVAQNDVQIIIETHSDHIINGIRVGVKEEPSLKDETVLFYFKKIVEQQEQFSFIKDIKIDKNGTLSNYPKNLLDEWSNQLSKLF